MNTSLNVIRYIVLFFFVIISIAAIIGMFTDMPDGLTLDDNGDVVLCTMLPIGMCSGRRIRGRLLTRYYDVSMLLHAIKCLTHELTHMYKSSINGSIFTTLDLMRCSNVETNNSIRTNVRRFNFTLRGHELCIHLCPASWDEDALVVYYDNDTHTWSDDEYMLDTHVYQFLTRVDKGEEPGDVLDDYLAHKHSWHEEQGTTDTWTD